MLRSFVREFAVELFFASIATTMKDVSSGTSVVMFACIVPFHVLAMLEYVAAYVPLSPRWKGYTEPRLGAASQKAFCVFCIFVTRNTVLMFPRASKARSFLLPAAPKSTVGMPYVVSSKPGFVQPPTRYFATFEPFRDAHALTRPSSIVSVLDAEASSQKMDSPLTISGTGTDVSSEYLPDVIVPSPASPFTVSV